MPKIDFNKVEKQLFWARFWKRQRKMFMTMWLIFGVFLAINFIRSTDSTDKSRWSRSGLSLYTDHKTGLQYIKGGLSGNMIPRLDVNGKHMRGEK